MNRITDRRPTNRRYSAGDVIQHRISGEVGVVVDRLGSTRLTVSLDDQKTTVWYAIRVRDY